MKSFNFRILLVVSCIVLISISSCKKEEDTVIIINPYEIILSNIKPKDVMTFRIECHSPVDLKSFKIFSKIESSLTTTAIDTAITGKNFSFRYDYEVPDLIESSRILIEFSIEDIDGIVTSNARVLDVTVLPVYLKETAGHELFSRASGKQNAYNLLTGTPFYSHLGDTLFMHIADTSNNSLLLRRWLSPAKVRFVRFNGFDYANCTNITVKNSYEAGIKLEFVDDLKQGDILLAKIPVSTITDSYLAIKVTSVIDDTGTQWDRYIFNIKK